jgi:uncharacterized protein YlxW (UPF0749 family)
MKKFRSQWAIGVVCLALGLMIAVQLKSVRGVDGGIVSPQRAQDLAIQITKLRDERDKLMEERKNNLQRIKEYEDNAASGDVVLQRLRGDLENMRMIAGLEDVQGPGIIITVTDPPSSAEGMDNFSLVTFYYEYLLLIINELNAAGVEAVSINDQRVISTTEIRIVGYHLSINGVKFSPPMVFKAIGNPEALEGALKLKNGVVETMTRDGIQVSIKPVDNLVVPKYNNIIRYRYAKPVN